MENCITSLTEFFIGYSWPSTVGRSSGRWIKDSDKFSAPHFFWPCWIRGCISDFNAAWNSWGKNNCICSGILWWSKIQRIEGHCRTLKPPGSCIRNLNEFHFYRKWWEFRKKISHNFPLNCFSLNLGDYCHCKNYNFFLFFLLLLCYFLLFSFFYCAGPRSCDVDVLNDLHKCLMLEVSLIQS